MKFNRTHNTIRNILFGGILKSLNNVLPFITRTMVLYILGAKYLGLGSLFSSILSFLSIAELGVSNAMLYKMYKPIADNDEKSICSLLNLYRTYYRYIGLIILFLGILLLPFLSKIINDDVPGEINIYLLYCIYLANTLLGYFLYAYRGSLIIAHQRNDIISKIDLVVTISQYCLQVILLIIFKNYYAYILCLPLATISTNLAQFYVTQKKYPNLKPAGVVSLEIKSSINKKIAALFGAKLNTVVLNTADNIVMSIFLGLTVIAVYNNYYFIMISICSIISICYISSLSSIGNSLATEKIEKNYHDFLNFSFLNAWIICLSAISLLCLYQPFMYIWVKGNKTLIFQNSTVFLFIAYFYLYLIRKIPISYKDAAGIWWEDRFRPYCCMVINVVSNIILVRYIGVNGIIVSTILSLCISIPWENYTVFKFIFHRSSKEYYSLSSKYLLVTLIAGCVTYCLCSQFSYTIKNFFIRIFICFFIPNIFWTLAFYKSREFNYATHLCINILQRI